MSLSARILAAFRSGHRAPIAVGSVGASFDVMRDGRGRAKVCIGDHTVAVIFSDTPPAEAERRIRDGIAHVRAIEQEFFDHSKKRFESVTTALATITP
jgi:hypothetical protein